MVSSSPLRGSNNVADKAQSFCRRAGCDEVAPHTERASRGSVRLNSIRLFLNGLRAPRTVRPSDDFSSHFSTFGEQIVLPGAVGVAVRSPGVSRS